MSVSGAAASGEGEGEEGGRIDRRNKGNAERERVTRAQVATQLLHPKNTRTSLDSLQTPPFKSLIFSFLSSLSFPLFFPNSLPRLFDFVSFLCVSNQAALPPPLPPLLRVSNFYLVRGVPDRLNGVCLAIYH